MVGRAAGIDPGFTDLSQPPLPTRRPLPILPRHPFAGREVGPPPSGRHHPRREPSLPCAFAPSSTLCSSMSLSLSVSLFLYLCLFDPRACRFVPFLSISLSLYISLPSPPLTLANFFTPLPGHPALAAALNATSYPQPRPQPQIARACQIAVHHGSLCRLQIDSRRRSDLIVPADAEQHDLRTRSIA